MYICVCTYKHIHMYALYIFWQIFRIAKIIKNLVIVQIEKNVFENTKTKQTRKHSLKVFLLDLS